VSAASSNPDEKMVTNDGKKGPQLWPAWVYCTRYSDRPSSGEFLLLQSDYSMFKSVSLHSVGPFHPTRIWRPSETLAKEWGLPELISDCGAQRAHL
jgi:hypothetical protein